MKTKNWQLPKYKEDVFFSKKNKYCVGIPVINEGIKIQRQLIKMKKYASMVDILIFDGGSTDGSMKKSFLKKQKVRALLTKISYGKQGTQLRMGCAFALRQNYEGIIILDGNEKDDIRAIPDFIKALDDGYDYIQGSRFIKGGKHINTPLIRYLGIRMIHAPILSLAARYWYTDTTNGFRAFSKRYLLDDRVNIFRDIFVKYEFFFYLTSRANQLNFKTKEIPVTRIYPKGELPTKIHGFKANLDLLTAAIKVLTKYYHP